MKLILGPYTTIADGIPSLIERLQEMGANTAQIYNGSPRSLRLSTKHKWTPDEIKQLHEANIPLWIHVGHLVHLAAHPIESRHRVLADMKDALLIGSPGVVVHTGFGKDIQKLVKQLLWLDKKAPKGVKIIVEVPSGETNHLGFPYEEYALLMKQLPTERFMIGLDTAHLFAGGVNLRPKNSFQLFIRHLGKWMGLSSKQVAKRIGLIHLNDAGSTLDSRIDYHAPLGRGYWLGNHLDGNPDAIYDVIRWAKRNGVPVILETKGDYAAEVKWIRKAEKGHIPLLKQENRQKGGQDKKELLIEILTDMKTYREMSKEPFRAQAYTRILGQLNRDETPFNAEHLDYWKSRPGVGKGLQEKMEEILQTGKLKEHEEIKDSKELNAWKTFIKIPGVGPSLASLWITQGERDLDDLKTRSNLTQKQRFGIDHFDDLQSRIPLKEAKWWQNQLETLLGDEVLLMGGFRTGKKTGGDMDFIITKDGKKLIAEMKDKGYIVEGDEMWLENGWNGYVRRKGGKVRQMDIRWVDKNQLVYWTLYFGSGIQWNQYLRQRAKELGYQLNQYGLYDRTTKERVKGIETEADIFRKLGVEYVEPKKRAMILPKKKIKA